MKDLVPVPLAALNAFGGNFSALASDEAEDGAALPSERLDRGAVADAFAALVGDEADADAPAVDVIDDGRGLALWGLRLSPDAVAVLPAMEDLSDPDAWLAALEEADLPDLLEGAIERLAQAMRARMEDGGEEAARAEFVRRLGDLLRQAGVDALAVARAGGGYDWVALNREDFAREEDGEPWTPPGGFDEGAGFKRIGQSLGLGGAVNVWPTPLMAPIPMPDLVRGAAGGEAPAAAPQQSRPAADSSADDPDRVVRDQPAMGEGF